MRLRFGQDMELNLQNALTTITPNIIRAAQQGNHKEQLTTWLTEATTDGMAPADFFSSSPLTPSITSIKLWFYENKVSFDILDHLKSAAILILPELFKERSKFFYCLDEVCSLSVINLPLLLLSRHPKFYQDITYTFCFHSYRSHAARFQSWSSTML